MPNTNFTEDDAFKYIDIEVIFDNNTEGEHIFEIIEDIVEKFNTKVVKKIVHWDKDDPMASDTEGGVALYFVYPNKPNLLEEFETNLADFTVELAVIPTKGF